MPHSDTPGSKPARSSPRIFAACHVLHRLLAPRHPPDALLMLINNQAHPPKRTGHTHHAQEPSTPPSRALRHTGRNALPIPRQAYIPHHTQHTHKTPLTAAAQPALSHGVSQHHSLGQTPMPAKPRTPPDTPRTQCVMNTHRPKSHPRCPARPEAHQNLIHNHQRTNSQSHPNRNSPLQACQQPPRFAEANTSTPDLSTATQPNPCQHGQQTREQQPSP